MGLDTLSRKEVVECMVSMLGGGPDVEALLSNEIEATIEAQLHQMFLHPLLGSRSMMKCSAATWSENSDLVQNSDQMLQMVRKSGPSQKNQLRTLRRKLI